MKTRYKIAKIRADYVITVEHLQKVYHAGKWKFQKEQKDRKKENKYLKQ
jgi:hypothetical protein